MLRVLFTVLNNSTAYAIIVSMETPNSALVELIAEGLTVKQIAHELACSQTTVKKYFRKFKLKTVRARSTKAGRSCTICGATLNGLKQKFCSRRCGTRGHSVRAQQTARKRGNARKQRLVELHGGCCKNCGYRKNFTALCFHHVDPKDKEFGIDSSKCSDVPWEVLYAESLKCILLCQNCHHELHNPTFMRE